MSLFNPKPAMNPAVLLAELQVMANSTPDFATYTPNSTEQFQWLGRTHALLERWNSLDAVSFGVTAGFLGVESTRSNNVTKLMVTLHRAIADLQLDAPSSPDQAFGPGAVYDFFKALKDLLGSATSSLMVIDPYLDAEVFDAYLSSVPTTVSIRLISTGVSDDLVHALGKYRTQHKGAIELRKTRQIHDRVVIIDDRSCWVLGQSIKDAARSKPTYIAPLSPDTSAEKVRNYSRIWDESPSI